MFDDIHDFLNEVQDTNDHTGNFIRRLAGARRRLANAIEKAEADVKSTNDETTYFAKVHKEIKPDIYTTVKNKMIYNVLHARLISEEFNEPEYKDALAEAITDNNSYLIRTVGQGFAATMRVDIDLNKTAGRLSQWSSGIKAYRKILEAQLEKSMKKRAKKAGKPYRKREYDPEQASAAWAGIYLKRKHRAEFGETITNRLELSGAVAPFWQIFDKGEVKMSSTRGGYATPVPQPTNFVQDSEEETNEYIKNLLTEKRQKFYEVKIDLVEILKLEKERLAEVDAFLNQIKLDKKVANQLSRKLEKEERLTDSRKLQKEVELVRKGLKTEGKVNVGPRGTRTLLSVQTIREYIL